MENIKDMLGQSKDKMNINKTDLEKRLETNEREIDLLKNIIKDLVNKVEKFENMIEIPKTMRDTIIKKGVENSSIQVYTNKVMTKILDLIVETNDFSKSNFVHMLFKNFINKYSFEEKRYFLDNIIEGNKNFEEQIENLSKRIKTFNYEGVDTEVKNGPFSGDEAGKKVSVVIEKSVKQYISEILEKQNFGRDNKLGQYLIKYFIVENYYLVEKALKEETLSNEEIDKLKKAINEIDISSSNYEAEKKKRG